MAMSLAACNTRPRLCEVNPGSANFFKEKLLFAIYEHFDEQDLIDVTFKLSNPSALITAHRLILSAASPYFKQLFKGEAGLCPLVEVKDIDSETFERLITFCYTGKALITIENVDQMLKASMRLQLDDAVTNCIDFLLEHINDYTLERTYALESETQCVLLSGRILEYELANFTSLMQSNEFLNFDFNKLKTLLEHDDLNVPTEKMAFEAVKRWYEHDASARKSQLPDIIKCLRLTQFDPNFLLTNIQPLPGCHLVALEALTWLNFPSSRSILSLCFTNSRKGTDFLAFNKSGGQYRSIFQYNSAEDVWNKWVDIDMDVKWYQVIFMDDNLIFFGGMRNRKVIKEVQSLNFKTKTFQQLPSMNQPRYSHAVVSLHDTIYAIGGKGADGEILKSVETYSVSNGWKEVNSMITPRFAHGAVVLNGKIYILGGQTKEKMLKSVECYDPTTNCWTQSADMNEACFDAGVTVHNGQIFVVGGGNSSKLVESYDPQRNEWTKICPLSTGFQLPGCISIDSQLWSVGGFHEDYKKCVSVYDDKNDKWIDKKPMPLGGFYYCFTVPKALLNSE